MDWQHTYMINASHFSWAPTFHKFGTELTLLYKLLWKTIPFTFLVLLFTWETSWSGENIWGVHDIKVHTTITPRRPHFILFCYFSCISQISDPFSFPWKKYLKLRLFLLFRNCEMKADDTNILIDQLIKLKLRYRY
jgi:hypothetical protein